MSVCLPFFALWNNPIPNEELQVYNLIRIKSKLEGLLFDEKLNRNFLMRKQNNCFVCLREVALHKRAYIVGVKFLQTLPLTMK